MFIGVATLFSSMTKMNFSKTPYITVQDHSVSKEVFHLVMDEELQLLKTEPMPLLEKLPLYYESDDYISHTDGKRSVFEKLYHFVKRRAIQNKLTMLSKWYPLKGGCLLDIGAGTGDFLSEAKKQGWQINGIEPNEKAKQIAIEKGVSFSGTIEELPDAFADVITMWHVLEHVPNLTEHIKQLHRVLQPDGTLFIAVPNYNSFDAIYYKEHWAAYDVPRHLWHFSKTAIRKIFEKENLYVQAIQPMVWDSYYVSLLSEKYKTGKMNFIKAFWVGWLSNRKAKAQKEYSSHIYILKKQQN